MQLAYGLQFGAWLVLYLALFATIKIRFPDSTPGKLLATIA
jgi:hypothetical protein